MKRKVLKYGLLILVGFLAIYQVFPKFGDYCHGIIQVFFFIFLIGLLALIFLIVLGYDLYNLKRENIKFDFKPTIIVGVIVSLMILSFNLEEKDLYRTKSISGIVMDSFYIGNSKLTLYDNKTFIARVGFIEWSCFYQGEYEIKDNLLKLKRKEITILTDSIFYSEYLINFQDSILIPTNSNFPKIVISDINVKK